MKKVFAFASLVVLVLAFTTPLTASEADWTIKLRTDDGAGMHFGPDGIIGTAGLALDGLDSADGPIADLSLDQGQATSWAVQVLADDVYYKSIKAPISPLGEKTWQFRVFALPSASYSSTRLSLLPTGSGSLPPSSIGGWDVRHTLTLLDNRGVPGAPSNGTIWSLAPPTVHDPGTPFFSTDLPVLKLSQADNQTALAQGYIFEYRVEPVPSRATCLVSALGCCVSFM